MAAFLLGILGMCLLFAIKANQSIVSDKTLPVAVVNENAAYQMFGGCDCVGETLYLNHEQYEIVDIVQEPQERAQIYIPYTTMDEPSVPDLHPEQKWEEFATSAGTASALEKMGYSLKAVNTIQSNSMQEIFMQWFWVLLILFSIGICAASVAGICVVNLYERKDGAEPEGFEPSCPGGLTHFECAPL